MFKKKTAYGLLRSLGGSGMCIRGSCERQYREGGALREGSNVRGEHCERQYRERATLCESSTVRQQHGEKAAL